MKTVDEKFFREWDFTRNLLICGNVGVGKTHAAKELLRRYRGKSVNPRTWTVAISDAKFKEFISAQQMGHKPLMESSSDGYMLEKLLRCEVLLFDDIGVTDTTDAYLRKLTYLLDERSEKGRRNIFTTNLTAKQLENHLNERIISRILHHTVIVEMVGPDRRRASTEVVQYFL